jgi:hypothetical protein
MPDTKLYDLRRVLRRTATSAFFIVTLAVGLAAGPALAADPLRGKIQIDQPTVLAGGNTVVYVVVNYEGLDLSPGVVSEPDRCLTKAKSNT